MFQGRWPLWIGPDDRRQPAAFFWLILDWPSAILAHLRIRVNLNQGGYYYHLGFSVKYPNSPVNTPKHSLASFDRDLDCGP